MSALTVHREQEIVQELRSLNSKFQKASRTAVEAGVRMGELLTEVRGDPSKNWGFGEWVEQHCEFSRQSAVTYMRAWEGFCKVTLQKAPTPSTITELAALAPSQRPTPIPPAVSSKSEPEPVPKPEPEPEPESEIPPCPGVRGTAVGQWVWSDWEQKWIQITVRVGEDNPSKEAPAPKSSGIHLPDPRQFLVEYVTTCSEPAMWKLLKRVLSIEHPDVGGSSEVASTINLLIERYSHE